MQFQIPHRRNYGSVPSWIPGSSTCFYYDGVKKCSLEVPTDQELLEMFSKHVGSKVVRMTITYTKPTDDVPIPESYTPEN
jgi:hypothetical protein